MATYWGHQEDASGNLLLPLPSSLVAAALIEFTDKAEHQHAEGDYLAYHNHLYKATKAIAVGNTLNNGDGGNISSQTIGGKFTSYDNKLSSADSRLDALETSVSNLKTYVHQVAINTVNDLISTVTSIDSHRFIITAGNSTMGSTLTGKSANCIYTAKNIDDMSRIDVFVIQPAIGKLTLLTINTSTKAITINWSNTSN